MMTEILPTTIDEAVVYVIAKTSPEIQARVAQRPKEDLILEHFGLGLWIRNNLGFYDRNSELLKACSKNSIFFHPDEASGMILEAVWLKLKEKSLS
jgi:hypothetical protein